MFESENFIDFKNSRLYYKKAGAGPKPLLLFHGFGQSHEVFSAWIAPLQKEYTLYAFDLFFHGQSTWPDQTAVENSDWKKILELFLEKEKIESFIVAGYSLGGKFALATVLVFSERIQKVFLLAPDGVRVSAWYHLATYPVAFRWLFKSMIDKPERFKRVIRTLRTLGLVHKGVLRFAESQMETVDKRRRVYFSWVYFRHLTFDLRKISQLLNRFRIPVTVIVGKYDKVIPAQNMIPFLAMVNLKKVEVLDAGHNDLIANAVGILQSGVVREDTNHAAEDTGK
jgi:pimeloyl-ACP methyl ester carboxylesterase